MVEITLQEFFEKVDSSRGSIRERVRNVSQKFTVTFERKEKKETYGPDSLRNLYITSKKDRVPKEREEKGKEEVVKPPSQLVDEDIQLRRKDAQIKELKAKYSHAIQLYEESNNRFEAAIQITEPINIVTLPPLLTSSRNESTALVLLSDWHIEEKVLGKTINDYNEYNLEIARERVKKCAQNILTLIKKERMHCDMNQIILWLGGDFITGYIHDELMESNFLSPIEAIQLAQELIVGVIDYIIKHARMESIVIPCNFGNHGRVNQKPKVSTANINSYEWMMYHSLKKHYSHNSKIQFVITDGIYNYINIYDKTLRTFHGDHVKFGGGIGGLTIPLTKVIQRADQQQKADYNIMGHYHQYWEATSNCLVNGSLIGYGAYAQRLGARPEPPTQGFRTLDKERFLTAKYPIFCD